MTHSTPQPASFTPLHCSLTDINIHIEPTDPPPPTPAILDRWAEASESNPRLFNGPILRYISHTAPGGPPPAPPTPTHPSSPRPHPSITARRDTYQRYAMQHHDAATADPACDIYHLAVIGVVLARDGHGNESVLLGKRGASTFVYPYMWEHAPGGGIESTDIYTQLLREMEEELGLTGLVDGSNRDEILEPPAPDDCHGLAIDPNTPSVDVVVRLRLREGAERAMGDPSWEYGFTRLVPIAKLKQFAQQEGTGAIIPPALAIWRGMGWI